MDLIEVNTERMQGDLRELETALTGLHSDLQEIEDEINALKDMWRGPAHDSYAVSFQNDCRQLNDFLQQVSQYIQSFQAAKDGYDRCEADIEEYIRAIAV